MATCVSALPASLLDVLRQGTLTEEQARRIYQQGLEAVVFALLIQAKRIAEQQAEAAAHSHETPSTPSGMKPTYQKPPGKRRKRPPGAKPGHPGSRRKPPEQIDHRKKHRAHHCPHCGGRLQRCNETRTRYTEDIPHIQPEVTEHTIHRDWCPKCKKQVEPVVPDALPGATLGNRVLVLSAWLHYGLGNTLAQIVEVFNFHLKMKITSGGLVQMWYRLQAILYAWYEQIQQQALRSAVLFADESGWRVNGKTHWLWCFTTRNLTFYMINRSRGSPALMKFFIEEFAGTLVTDFWGAYNALARVRQEAAPVAGRRHPALASARRSARCGLRIASRADRRPLAGVARHALEGRARQTADQTPPASSKRPVHVPGPTGRSFRQQHGGAGDPARGDHPQKQLRQPERARGGLPIGPHVHLPHPQTTRVRSHSNHHASPGLLPHHRSASPAP